ncbi:hypothetical protein OUZ56_002110 [Daphnia magna]|uniref:Uncharacterized protein n=1 Tax=Daphnia magna TaxID=35525 RepID=A0ABR0A511_9CRUS|nr:hypothetical protein OUZ56_002110 [Daphnia magna]
MATIKSIRGCITLKVVTEYDINHICRVVQSGAHGPKELKLQSRPQNSMQVFGPVKRLENFVIRMRTSLQIA